VYYTQEYFAKELKFLNTLDARCIKYTRKILEATLSNNKVIDLFHVYILHTSIMVVAFITRYLIFTI